MDKWENIQIYRDQPSPFGEGLTEDRFTINPLELQHRLQRVEEMISDLIGFIANTRVKTINGENHLIQLEHKLSQLELKYKLQKRI